MSVLIHGLISPFGLQREVEQLESFLSMSLSSSRNDTDHFTALIFTNVQRHDVEYDLHRANKVLKRKTLQNACLYLLFSSIAFVVTRTTLHRGIAVH